MATITWETLKVRYCDTAETQVELQAEMIYPAEWLPDQPARVLAHRCSHGLVCMANGQGACCWSGANPDYDPFMK